MGQIQLRHNGPVTAITAAEITERFLQAADVKEASRQTYGRQLSQLFRYAAEKGVSITTMDRPFLIQYKADCLATLTPATVAGYVQVMRKFFSWLEQETSGMIQNIAAGIKTPKQRDQFTRKAIGREKAGDLLRSIQNNTLEGKRTAALVQLMMRTGIRTIEAARANIEDIETTDGKRILRVHGKGRDDKSEFVVLTDAAYKPLQEYLKSRGRTTGKTPLFIGHGNKNNGQRLTTRTISGIVKAAMISAGIDGREYTAHSLRHTAATSLMKAGRSLYETQLVLRHRSPVTTQRYLKMFEEEHRLENAPEAALDSYF